MEAFVIIFITGGQASGKSDYALNLLHRLHTYDAPPVFVATGKAQDEGLREQIRLHRDMRPARIPVFESGVDLASCLRQALQTGRTVLLDGLDFWYFLVMQEADFLPEKTERRCRELLDLLDETARSPKGQDKDASTLILVSSETGLGPVAADSMTRAFTRGLGRLNTKIAVRADSSWLVVAGHGIPLDTAP
jgi:adenosylcobinamide kinase/adenosylcobinamide-phosphate guanylyltransferase